MPYNTRRKSLSLPSLGIHVPSSSRAARRSPSTSTSKLPTTSEIPPPSKKVKRSHDTESQSPATSQNGELATEARIERAAAAYAHTPPPSPADVGGVAKIDTEGINDDIIVAVIEQLEKTGNRPHLIKELATVLSTASETIANSANAAALISSRLSMYLKRPWSALAPCPIAKEQIPVHPRKVFFYLTNSPAQPLPDDSSDIISPLTPSKQITPSISNSSVDEEDAEDALERSRMSPSPEVDLSSPAFDHEEAGLAEHTTPGRPPTPTGSYPMRNRMANNYRLSNSSRAVSPPLEGDEKEFTMTASSVRERTSADDAVATKSESPVLEESSAEEAVVRDEASMDDCFVSHGPQSQQYYFSARIIQTQEAVDAANPDVLGTSPSPSMSSELSSLSSASSATSDVEIDDLGTTNSSIPLGIETSTSKYGSVSGCKRSLDMIDTGFGFHLDSTLDSWLDLQSPEAIEIHELDAIFADI